MKKALIIVLLAVLLAVSIFPQSGAVGKGKIKGYVFDEKTGQPLAGVTVKLYSVRAQTYYLPAPKTDSEGKWKALYIRGGSWNIDFEKEGYETKKISYSQYEMENLHFNDINSNLFIQ